MENTEITPEVEAKETEETTTEPQVEVKEEKVETVSEALKLEEKKDDSVPLSKFLDTKKSNKELAQKVRELEKKMEDGATKKEISSDVKSLASEHGVDEAFLTQFAEMIQNKTTSQLEDKFSEQIKPLTERSKKEQIDKLFDSKWEQLIAENPEYKDVAKKDVIKSFALQPQNVNKPFTEILNNVYGHTIKGRQTIESSTPRGGKDDNHEIDFNKARNDVDYFREIMANPKLKAKYNENLHNRV